MYPELLCLLIILHPSVRCYAAIFPPYLVYLVPYFRHYTLSYLLPCYRNTRHQVHSCKSKFAGHLKALFSDVAIPEIVKYCNHNFDGTATCSLCPPHWYRSSDASAWTALSYSHTIAPIWGCPPKSWSAD